MHTSGCGLWQGVFASVYSSLGISSFSSLYSLSRRRAAEGGGDLMAEVVYRPTGLVSDKPMTAKIAAAVSKLEPCPHLPAIALRQSSNLAKTKTIAPNDASFRHFMLFYKHCLSVRLWADSIEDQLWSTTHLSSKTNWPQLTPAQLSCVIKNSCKLLSLQSEKLVLANEYCQTSSNGIHCLKMCDIL